MQYIFIRKYTIFIGLSALKVTGYDIKSGILYARNKRNLIAIPGLMSYPVTLRPDNPVKMEYFLLKIYCISS